MTLPHDDGAPATATASLPALKVEPDLLLALEAVLRDGESVAEFMEGALRSAIQKRSYEADLTQQADASWRDYQRTGISAAAATVFDEVEKRLARRRQELGG